MTKLVLLGLFVSFVAIAFLVTVVVLRLRARIRATITNTGSEPLNSVILHVTGNDYPLGDLAPGTSARASVHSTDGSSLKIEFKDSGGDSNEVDADVDIEPGYKGSIAVSIKDGMIESTDAQINVAVW